MSGGWANGWRVGESVVDAHAPTRTSTGFLRGWCAPGWCPCRAHSRVRARDADPPLARRFAFNSGEVCTCPSRALIQESIFERFMARALERVKLIKAGNPLDSSTMLGAQNSALQLERILAYLKVGKDEGAEVLAGGEQLVLDGGGFYVQPTVFKGHNNMRVFREEIFGPVLCVTTFKTEAEALALANDTPYGLGAGVWTRDINTMHRMSRGIKAGRVWGNNYHAYPAHAGLFLCHGGGRMMGWGECGSRLPSRAE